MVGVGPVAMRVNLRRMPMHVAVLSLDGWIVHVVMMSVVVTMSVLVFQRFVSVRVLMPFGEVKVQRGKEKKRRDDGHRADGSISEQPSRDGADEGRYRKNRARATRPDRALGSQIKPKAEAVAEGPADEQRQCAPPGWEGLADHG